jgi:hypothetical protein
MWASRAAMSGRKAMLMRRTTPGRSTWPLGRGIRVVALALDLPIVTVSNRDGDGFSWVR